jgi:hypothetical protein
MSLPPNPVAIPTVTYEDIFCHPSSEQLNGRLRSYCQSLVPWVPWVASYSPKI